MTLFFVWLTPLLVLFATLQPALADTAAPLSLTQAMAIALASNRDIRLADLAISSAEAGIRIADTAPNPTLTVSASNLNTQAGIGSGDLRSKTFDSAVRIDQLIERGDKRLLRTKNAAALTDASRFDAHDIRRQTKTAVAQAFYDLLGAQERVSITEQGAVIMAQTLAAGKRRLKAGDLAPSDVTRIEVDSLRAENDVSQARSDRTRAQVALAQLLADGRRPDALTVIAPWPTPVPDQAFDVEAFLPARADVRAAQARLDAAMAAAKLAAASRTRDVTVGLQYDHFPASPANSQGNGNSIGISVQIPLFWRSHFDGEILSAELAVETAQATLERMQEAVRAEIGRLSEDAHGSAQRLSRFDEQLLPAAKKSADAAEFAFQHGAIAIMDVLDVRRTYRLALLEAVAARTEHAKAAAALTLATASEQKP